MLALQLEVPLDPKDESSRQEVHVEDLPLLLMHRPSCGVVSLRLQPGRRLGGGGGHVKAELLRQLQGAAYGVCDRTVVNVHPPFQTQPARDVRSLELFEVLLLHHDGLQCRKLCFDYVHLEVVDQGADEEGHVSADAEKLIEEAGPVRHRLRGRRTTSCRRQARALGWPAPPLRRRRPALAIHIGLPSPTAS
eukprot:scaffold1282_cov251-Pinguiococcus_pyrenoidosus.AAC.75